MKDFNELTESQIRDLNKEEFKLYSPFQTKHCSNCYHLISALSFYCGNTEAIEHRGTTLPGVVKCTFWKPDWKHIPKEYKTNKNGYKKTKTWYFSEWLKNKLR